ncbi:MULTISPECIES: hypothetical protein [Chryseobacterium]|uniref:Uncharacterized protein n=1 Tax=Chryseobacterium salivictor TaxID=2547600 RepID=A0A4P6ZG09_9FLAO|nr:MULTISPECIES: hypothetical protein [Chryseobacterium]MDQ0477970.1 hypothetical protein [Chryseobacterium sp. MDT2-18]QBO58442.1 hypothetical protein NBC122_01627 [Chryseobacterium salivictor]
MKYFLSVFLLIITSVGCENKLKSNEADLIKVGYYPPFIQHFEIIANLSNKSLLFYNPSKYLIPPPPPPPKNASDEELKRRGDEHQKFVDENPKLEPEYLELNNDEIKAIQKIITSFQEKDFKEDEKKYPIIDGANTNTVIQLKDHRIYSIGGYEGTNTDKEIELTSKIFSLFKLKSNSKVNKLYIEKLERR